MEIEPTLRGLRFFRAESCEVAPSGELAKRWKGDKRPMTSYNARHHVIRSRLRHLWGTPTVGNTETGREIYLSPAR